MDINISKRITEDTITIGERTFVLTKYDPLVGNFILFKLTTMILPFGLNAMLGQAAGGATELLSNSSKATMSKQEFIELQRDILSTCFERLKGTDAPVVTDNGTYGISNFSMDIALQLLIASISFNFASFFGESGLNLDSIKI